jgi:hypothetical protein
MISQRTKPAQGSGGDPFELSGAASTMVGPVPVVSPAGLDRRRRSIEAEAREGSDRIRYDAPGLRFGTGAHPLVS